MNLKSILYLLICLLAIACQDDLDGDLAHGGGMTEGMATFRFELESATEIYTRADDASADAIENVMLMVFDKSNILTKSAYFDAEVGGNVATRDLQDKIRVEVNGVAVRLDELVLEVDSPASYYAWKAVTVSGCPLRAGENVLSIEALAYGAPNMDVVYIYKT